MYNCVTQYWMIIALIAGLLLNFTWDGCSCNPGFLSIVFGCSGINRNPTCSMFICITFICQRSL